jgi:hypothetical protein
MQSNGRAILIPSCLTIVLALILICLLLHATNVFNQRNSLYDSLDKTNAVVSSLRGNIARLESEKERLSQTPRFYYGRAVDEMEKAATDNTDDADSKAISLFQDFAKRFPDDPLAKPATVNIIELEKHVSKRNSDIQEKQAQVAQLITVCKENSLRAREIEESRPNRFTQSGEIDYNYGLATSTASSPYKNIAYNAQQRARALLEGLPDPGDILGMKSATCYDEPNK